MWRLVLAFAAALAARPDAPRPRAAEVAPAAAVAPGVRAEGVAPVRLDTTPRAGPPDRGSPGSLDQRKPARPYTW